MHNSKSLRITTIKGVHLQLGELILEATSKKGK